MQWDLALYDLIVPYVLRAAPLGAIHAAVSAIFVQEYDEAVSEQGVVVRGTARISGQVGAFFDPTNGTFAVNAQNVEGHPRDDSGRRQPWIDLRDTEIEFQLHATREASAIVTGGAGALDDTNDADTIAVLNALDSSPAAPAVPPAESDYPGTTFSLDMVVTGAVLRPPFLYGAELQPDGNLLPVSGDDTVEITLPRFKIHIAQGPMAGVPLIVDMHSYGATGLDDPGDIAVAELIKMTPPYAFIGNGHTVGIGFERAVLDLSNQSTPPEVLEQFGYDNTWTGLFLPDLRLFVAPNGLEDFAVSAGAHNLLIGFGPQGGISGDFDLAVIDQGGDDLSISARFVDRQGTVYGIEHLSGGEPATATAWIPMFTQMIVDVAGGLPPYTISVTPSVEVDIDETNQRVHDVTLTPDPGRITIAATDSRPEGGLSRELVITLNHRTSPAVRPPGGGVRAPTIDDQASTRNGIDVDRPEIVIIGYTKDEVNLALRPPPNPDVGIEWRVDGEPSGAARVLSVALAPGASLDVSARFTATPSATDHVTAFFRYNQPGLGDAVGESGMNATEAIDEGSYSPWVNGPSNVFGTHLETFEAIDPDETITITGFASYEGQDADEDPGNKVRGNYELARRRALAFQAAISERLSNRFPTLRFQIAPGALQGTDFPTDWAIDWQNQDGAQQSYWRADAAMQVSAAPVDFVAAARVTRPQAPAVPAQPQPPEDPEPPPWFHSIAAKVRIVRDKFVAVELSGEVDFQTAIEEQLNSPDGEGEIDIPLQGLGNNPVDGVVAYRVLVQVDDATGEWIVKATVGADPADIDGLVRTPPPTEAQRHGRNMLGMATAMAPVLAAVAPANPLNGEIAPLVVQGGVLGLLNALAIGEVLNVERVILYGAEAIVRQRSSGPEINLLFDVETAISARVVLGGSELLTIPADNPLVVRYKAIGVRLGYTPPETRFQFRPVFDASKGYTLDLSGPGGIQVGEPLGRILKVLGARMAPNQSVELRDRPRVLGRPGCRRGRAGTGAATTGSDSDPATRADGARSVDRHPRHASRQRLPRDRQLGIHRRVATGPRDPRRTRHHHHSGRSARERRDRHHAVRGKRG